MGTHRQPFQAERRIFSRGRRQKGIARQKRESMERLVAQRQQLTGQRNLSPRITQGQLTEVRTFGRAGLRKCVQACQIAKMKLDLRHERLMREALMPRSSHGAHQDLAGADLPLALPQLQQT